MQSYQQQSFLNCSYGYKKYLIVGLSLCKSECIMACKIAVLISNISNLKVITLVSRLSGL